LLKPSFKSPSGHRFYSEDDLLRLQQIVTLKYMGFSLSAIKEILENPDFDVRTSLATQATTLAEEAQRIKQVGQLLGYLAGQLEAKQAINWQSMANIIEILEMSKMTMQTVTQRGTHPEASELGKKSDYISSYSPDKLFPIPRQAKRVEIGIDTPKLPFFGFDYWNHYEVSWLNEKGKPVVALAEIVYDCNTPNIIESKSLKLYFNSFNNSKFKTVAEVERIIKSDLESRLGGDAYVKVLPLNQLPDESISNVMHGTCLDDLDITCTDYQTNPAILTTDTNDVEETLYSNLLKSNCLVTNQPDWGTVEIHYKGKKINHENLLKYIISFRNHNEFHEQCIERIFVDIMQYCQPKELTVYGRYTRRGGLDINPYRSTNKTDFQGKNRRLIRQ
jgi:7-cyano-7-deazaguanine reductase